MSAVNVPTGITADSMFQSPRSWSGDTALVAAGAELSKRASDFSQLMSVKSAGRNKKIKYL